MANTAVNQTGKSTSGLMVVGAATTAFRQARQIAQTARSTILSLPAIARK
jgi:hypothetical protein